MTHSADDEDAPADGGDVSADDRDVSADDPDVSANDPDAIADGEDGSTDDEAVDGGDESTDDATADDTDTTRTDADRSGDDAGADGSPETGEASDELPGDTFGVAIRATDREFRFLVRVPSQIDSGWTDPEAFQSRIERATWERLDKGATLRAVDRVADPGDTVTLGTVRMRPDGTVVTHTLAPPDTDA